jgi:hypothetical protein
MTEFMTEHRRVRLPGPLTRASRQTATFVDRELPLAVAGL